MVSEPDLSAALTLRVVVPLQAADAEVLKQRLDALIVAVEVAEEKAAIAHRRVLATRQLLDEEQAAVKKLVPGSTSFSTTETTTASLSYIDTIVANLHIQADNMMEEIHSVQLLLRRCSTPTKRCPLHCRRLWHCLARLARTTTAASTMITIATTTGIGTITAAMVVVATRITTMVETTVATPPATPPWFPTTPPPTTIEVPRYGRRL
jgi:hypothetical protein